VVVSIQAKSTLGCEKEANPQRLRFVRVVLRDGSQYRTLGSRVKENEDLEVVLMSTGGLH
jgi:hypothetical protein